MLNEYLTQLQKKYNYDNLLIENLSKIIPSLIEYYGVEYQNQILSALYNCEIHIQKENENSNEYLNNYFDVNEKWNFPIGGAAFHTSKPKVADNKVTFKNIIYICKPLGEKFDLYKEENLSTLIHEICHLVKGFNRAKIEDGKIISTTGFMKEEFDFQGISLNGDYAINVGIEEALNCYDEEKIMEKVVGHSYTSQGYHGISKLIGKLLKNNEIKNAIDKAKFGENSDWINLIGTENVKKLIENFDTIIKTSYVSNADFDFDEDAEFDRLLEEGKNFDEIQEILIRIIEEERDKIWEPYNLAYSEVESFIEHFTIKQQLINFETARTNADKKAVEYIQNMSINYKTQENVLNLEVETKFK